LYISKHWFSIPLIFTQGVQELVGRVVNDVRSYKLDAARKGTSDRLMKEHPEYTNRSKDEFNAIVQSEPGYKAMSNLWHTGAVAGAPGGLSANNQGLL